MIALPAWVAGQAFPLLGGPVLAILAGILITMAAPKLLKRELFKGLSFNEGVKYTSKKLLQVSIVLLGFNMNFFNVLRIGGMSLAVLACVFLTGFIMAYFGGRLLRLPGNTSVLIGVGTSVCGGSAIAAVAPVIRAQDEDVTRAISTIFLFNVAAVLIFPALGRFLGMDDTVFGVWAAAAINDTSSVVAAGTAWSHAAGYDIALEVATIVKLTRTLAIIPIAVFFAFYSTKKAAAGGAEGGGDFSFAKIFPWFILFFLGSALANTFLGLPQGLSPALVRVGQFAIVMAMAAIGLNTDFKSLFSSGAKPILLGGLSWLAVAAASLAALRLLF